ncbi:MAG: sodium:solute symporter [bacterium]
MRSFDWVVLAASLVFIVAYGVWKGRRNRDLDGYILGDQAMRWYTVAFSIMATQASAITFISTPGQAYVDGMRFVQFYFGLPLAMIVLSVTVVPLYRKLKIYTAYEFLERRFDVKVRSLAAFLFLIQRGLACGLTIYAPAVVLSVLLGWNLYITNLVIGVLVIIYTASGGAKAVAHTNFWQMVIILGGMIATLVIALSLLPESVSFGDAVHVAGVMGRLNAIDFSFDLKNRYTFWSGLIGGFFLALSYFGTDQSQVGRYISGQSVAQSRIGLLFNGLVKVPMQFVILFIGAMVFVFHQFNPTPVYFNPVEAKRVEASAHAGDFQALQKDYDVLSAAKTTQIQTLLEARRAKDAAAEARAATSVAEIQAEGLKVRAQAKEIVRQVNPRSDGNDVNYIFLTFVLQYLPVGVVGLVIAMIFAASMSSTASELNALASTTVVDFYRRFGKRDYSDRHLVAVSKTATVVWGGLAILFAEYANRLGSLVEAVNILGSLFYGTILGIFLLAFYFKRAGGTAVFIGALAGEAAVVLCFTTSGISFLWYNVVGCLVTIAVALAISHFRGADLRPYPNEITSPPSTPRPVSRAS